MARTSLHEMHLPGESAEYRRARDELLTAEMELRRQAEAVAAQRRRLPLGGEVPEDYTFEEWDAAANTGRPVRLSELFADGKDTLFLYSHMYIPGKAGLPLEGLPGVHLDHRRNRWRGAAHHAADQFRGRCEAADRALSRARAVAWMASRPAALLSEHDLQPRLPRGGARRRAATCGHGLRAPRRQDPSLVEQRADVDPQRARPGPPARRLHVAAMVGARPHPAGRGGSWTPKLDYAAAG